MKAAVVCLVAAFYVDPAVAAEYGIGISAKSDNGLIYVPIDVSPKFRIEPHVRYSTDDSNSVDTTPPTVTLAGQDTETLEVGAGIFGLSLPNESLRIYYGGRVGYVDVRTEFTLDFNGVTVRDRTTSDGYKIAPTFGFEYIFNAHFTLGGEMTYFYERLEADSARSSIRSDTVGERYGTESFLILRYFF
jgi:hypothetical protein